MIICAIHFRLCIHPCGWVVILIICAIHFKLCIHPWDWVVILIIHWYHTPVQPKLMICITLIFSDSSLFPTFSSKDPLRWKITKIECGFRCNTFWQNHVILNELNYVWWCIAIADCCLSIIYSGLGLCPSQKVRFTD